MQDAFGADFSGVQIHRDTSANQLASQLNAKAFTVGRDIYFGSGYYTPQSLDGSRVLATNLRIRCSSPLMPELPIGRLSRSKPARRSIGTRSEAVAAQVTSEKPVTGQEAALATQVQGSSALLCQRQNADVPDPGEEPAITRDQEITLARTSPGEYTGERDPLSLSLYNLQLMSRRRKRSTLRFCSNLDAFLARMLPPPL